MVNPQPTPVLVAGTAVTAGAALLPDLDHGGSTATRSLGPLTWLLGRVVQVLSGGHRRGTHSLLGCTVLALAVQAAVQARPGVVGAIATTVLLAVILAAVVRLFRIPGWWDEAVAVLAAGALAWWPGLDLTALGPAVFVGTVVHALGDAITRQGIPFWWPISSRNVRLAKLKAGGPTERWVLRPAFFVALPVVLFWEPIRGLWP